MKTVFEFANGEIRFDYNSTIYTTTEEEKVIKFGFKGIDYVKREATEMEINTHNQEMQDIQKEYDIITKYNNAIAKGNKRLVESTNIDEFLNAYK